MVQGVHCKIIFVVVLIRYATFNLKASDDRIVSSMAIERKKIDMTFCR